MMEAMLILQTFERNLVNKDWYVSDSYWSYDNHKYPLQWKFDSLDYKRDPRDGVLYNKNRDYLQSRKSIR